MKLSVLPENFLKCMTPSQRKEIGQKSASEALASGQAKSERQLQGQIVNLLRLKGIEPLWHRTDKKSAATIGWPDITFCVYRVDNSDPLGTRYWPTACLWEIKFGNGQLSEEQAALRPKLEVNGWNYRVIRSVDQALAGLKELGIT